jgi:DNA ligase 1
MKSFAFLIEELDKTNKTHARIAALCKYFSHANDSDKLWAIAILNGRRPKRPVTTTLLRTWAADLSGVPEWLFEESYHVVGDLAETIALLVKGEGSSANRSLEAYMQDIISLGKADEDRKKAYIAKVWQEMDYYETFLFNKLLTGGFRIGVSTKMVVRALSIHTGVEENVLAHRLSGNWEPGSISYQELITERDLDTDASQPYPFCLAYPLDDKAEDLGDANDWVAEYKWDGIRGQLISRRGQWFLWSRGEELITDKFPEFESFAFLLPEGTVLDGEILPMMDGKPMNFQHLQTRIGRKTLSKKLLQEVPVHFVAYDLLEWKGEDIRTRPLAERRNLLKNLGKDLDHPRLLFSDALLFSNWEELSREMDWVREKGAEGFMLKHRASAYQTGRKKGDWWKWKLEPLTIDAVLIYAMAGHGRRANLYTDYTFAVWDEDRLVPFAKAYSGLTDKEIVEVDAFVRKHTVEKFGPVRSVRPELVFEIAFEGIQASGRHKSGIALRFPRMKRWRKDKPAEEANTLMDLQAILEQFGK